MKGNIWIHLSSLALCFAIGYRVWEFKEESTARVRIEKISSSIQENLMEKYFILIDKLTLDSEVVGISKYEKELVGVVKYLFESEDDLKLKDLYLKNQWIYSSALGFESYESKEGRLYTEVEIVSKFDKVVRKCYYATGLLERIFVSKEDSQLDALTVEAKVIDLKGINKNIFGINFDFYWDLSHKQNIKYLIDGNLQPTIDGGAATKEVPDQIDVSVKCDVTGGRRLYNFNKLKA